LKYDRNFIRVQGGLPNAMHSGGITGSPGAGVHQHSEPPGQERLTHAGGHETLVVTGEPWPSCPGPGTADDLHDGFRTWLRSGFQDEDWAGGRTVDHDDARLSPELPATGTAHLPPAPAADLVQRLRRSSATPSA
jgi:hypothetical protein